MQAIPVIGLRRRIAAEFDALWALTKRNVTQSSRGTPGRGAFMMKLAYSEARQKLGELSLQSTAPEKVSSRCVVFAEGEILTLLGDYEGALFHLASASALASVAVGRDKAGIAVLRHDAERAIGREPGDPAEPFAAFAGSATATAWAAPRFRSRENKKSPATNSTMPRL